MPNIGIKADNLEAAMKIRNVVDSLMVQMGLAGDAITTIELVTTKHCDSEKTAPYTVVRDSNAEEAKRIADALSAVLPEEDIEIEQALIGFIAGKKPEVIPPPQKGTVVYVGPNDDCLGGWGIVESVCERMMSGKPCHMIRLLDFPLREFNWTVLMKEQDALKAQYGDQQAKSELADTTVH